MSDTTPTRTTKTTPTATTDAGPVPAPPERTLARGPVLDGVGSNGRPEDPEAMRVEIERTRERMSYTLDAIEHRLVLRKREIWAKATLQGFRRKISTEPWRSMAIAFAAGYIVAAIRD